MGKVASNNLKNWKDGETVTASDYKKERDLIVTANNDTHDRFLDEQSNLQTLEDTVNANETTRQNNETTRETNETNRVNAESTRESQEADRQTNTSTAISNAETATTNANNAATNANEQAQHAKTQGDYAKSVGDNAKTNWLAPVSTYTDVTTSYPSPIHGDTVMTTSDSKVYRYQNGSWAHTQNITDSGLSDVQAKLSLQDQQEQTLVHGLQVINSDTASNLKVEFYGVTRTNLLGKDGNDSDLTNWSTVYGSKSAFTKNTTQYKYGVDSLKSLNPTTGNAVARNITVENGKYYIILADIFVSSRTDGDFTIRIGKGSSSTYVADLTPVYTNLNSWQLKYLKLTPDSTYENIINIRYANVAGTHDISIDGVRLLEISKEQYDKIGVSLLDSDVERMFPYVDGIKGVKHSVLKVEGTQLFNIYDVDLDANAEITAPNEITLNATNYGQGSVFTKECIGSTGYTISASHNGVINVKTYDENETFISKVLSISASSGSFTTNSNAKSFTIEFVNNTQTGTFTFSDIMLNLGDTALPYTDYNPSYLCAETTLYGNDDKKDILYKNESLDVPRWEVKREWGELTLDGSISWVFGNDYSGFKSVNFPEYTINNFTDQFGGVKKYDGSIITKETNETFSKSDQYRSYGTSNVWFSISDTDSGWTESMTPTADMIKGYFNGWKYTGDGTTHSWVSIVDGISAPATQTEAFVADPVNSPSSFENYFLLYQLSESVVEPVTVEGDVSISGDAQVEVGEGVIVREEVTPIYRSTDKTYNINRTDLDPSGYLSNKALKIINVYKNGESDLLKDFTSATSPNWQVVRDSVSYGKERIQVRESDYDPTATYTVTYEILDKYDFTTNLNEVKATYHNSIKSSFNGVVAKQSDIATQTNINKNSIVEIYAVLKENNLM